MTTISVRHGYSGRTMLNKVLLSCGILSSLVYIAMNIFIPMQYEGYDYSSRTISELSAIDAPTRSIWTAYGLIYSLMAVAFGLGVWKSAGANRPLRIAGILLLTNGLLSFLWPPMHQREVLAAGGGTMTDTMHIAFSFATVLLFMLSIGFGAAAFGKRFRIYSIVTLIVLTFFWYPDRNDGFRFGGQPSHPNDGRLGTDQYWCLYGLGDRSGPNAFKERKRSQGPLKSEPAVKQAC